MEQQCHVRRDKLKDSFQPFRSKIVAQRVRVSGFRVGCFRLHCGNGNSFGPPRAFGGRLDKFKPRVAGAVVAMQVKRGGGGEIEAPADEHIFASGRNLPTVGGTRGGQTGTTLRKKSTEIERKYQYGRVECTQSMRLFNGVGVSRCCQQPNWGEGGLATSGLACPKTDQDSAPTRRPPGAHPAPTSRLAEGQQLAACRPQTLATRRPRWRR